MIISNQQLISVIVPCYNPPFKYFKEAIESILSQSYINWEVVVVNDGSNNKNKIFMEEYIKNLNDKRFSIVNLNENRGQAYAKNIGIESSKGEIITFLDSDDIHLPWYYQEILDNFDKKPNCQVLLADSVFLKHLWNFHKKIYLSKLYSDLFDVSGNPYELIEKVTSINDNMLGRLSFKREVLKKFTFDSENFFEGDLDLILQILGSNEFNLGTIAKPVYLYRIYPSRNRATHKLNRMIHNTNKAIDKYINSKNSVGYKYIESRTNNSDYWRFAPLVNSFIKNASISNYLKEAFSSFKSKRDRTRSIKFLLRLFISYKFLIPITGVPLGYLSSYISTKNNKYNVIKNMFKSHLTSINDSKTRYHLEKMYKKLFA